MRSEGRALTQRTQLLLARIEALRPELLEAAEALAYDARSPRWVRKHYGEEIWQELQEFVARNLWTQWRF